MVQKLPPDFSFQPDRAAECAERQRPVLFLVRGPVGQKSNSVRELSDRVFAGDYLRLRLLGFEMTNYCREHLTPG